MTLVDKNVNYRNLKITFDSCVYARLRWQHQRMKINDN